MPIAKSMKQSEVIAALSALAQENRLDIFRCLVEQGNAGLPAGLIAERLQLPSATLSFHLKTLKQSGLLRCRRESRSLIYSVDFGRMSALLGYLSEDCCQGHPEVCGVALGVVGPGDRSGAVCKS